MSPFEHGEVFVLDDGGEADLDLGNYERFLGVRLSRDHNITTGKVSLFFWVLVDFCLNSVFFFLWQGIVLLGCPPRGPRDHTRLPRYMRQTTDSWCVCVFVSD